MREFLLREKFIAASLGERNLVPCKELKIAQEGQWVGTGEGN